MVRFEWLWLELLLVGFLIWEFIRTRRMIRRDRAARENARKDGGG